MHRQPCFNSDAGRERPIALCCLLGVHGGKKSGWLFDALHMLFVKLNQLRADTKPWVLNGTASDIRDGGLGAFALLRKLHLRHASGHKLVDKKFPVHADDYRATDIHRIGYPMNGRSTLLP